MQRYIVQRLLLTIPTLLGITLLTFVGLRVVLPNSVIDLIVGEYARNDEDLRRRLEEDLGLTGSIPIQYLKWMGDILTGDLGESLHSHRPVADEMKSRIPVSMELGLIGFLSGVLIAVPLGMVSAIKQDGWPDYLLRSLAILLNAVPGFWIAILLITFGSIWFNWAPTLTYRSLTEDPIAHLKIMLPPALIIGLTPSGGLVRLVRTQMLEVLREDYIRTARAKGLASKAVFTRHALRNALIPIVTDLGTRLPTIIAGTVIFEQIFIIPGMGRYLVDAVNVLDYPVIQATNLILATLLVFSVLLVDLAYPLIDPRIRYG